MYIGNSTWPGLREYFEEDTLALIPIGSTEQHGPHLPLATDYLISEAFAREAADRTAYLCTPTVYIGVSAHHKQFHGTMWVDAPAFRDYIESMTQNLAYHGIDRVIYVNSHGGNVEHLREVGRRLRDDQVIYAIEWMWNESIPDLVDNLFEQNGPHAGPKETALLMHLAETLVRTSHLSEARNGGTPDITTNDTIINGARTYYDAIDNTANGVTGDPSEATAEKGERLFEEAVSQLVELCAWLDSQDFEDLMPEPHI